MRGQETTFHDNVSATCDLFPEIEVLSDNPACDLVVTGVFMSVLVMSYPALARLSLARWHVITWFSFLSCCLGP